MPSSTAAVLSLPTLPSQTDARVLRGRVRGGGLWARATRGQGRVRGPGTRKLGWELKTCLQATQQPE